MRHHFRVTQVDGGFVLFYGSRRWAMEPKDTRAEARAYGDRLVIRWPTEDLVNDCIDYAEYNESIRRQGGPWRWSMPDGETGVVQCSRLADAKSVERSARGVQKLPKGMSWKVAA